MARKTVISKVLDEVPEDDVLVLPANRTLYADQFTDPAPTPDEERECFVPRSFADVFVHYQPCKKGIELITDDGKIVYEDFFFTCIEDFDDERLIAKSKVLACSRQHLKENLFNVREEIRELEIAYRTLSSFYDNVGKYADCVCLMNVDKAELGFYDSDDTCAVRQELESHYQCLDLRENYSLLVLPGYHGCGDIIRMWARVAYRNKVLMITDFKDCISFEDLKNSLDHADLQGADAYNSNVVMTVNYILGRKKSECADEGDDLYIPASGALAGRMANIDDIAISQACAGEEYGILTNVDSTRVDLSEMEIAELSDMGVIPITRKGCHVMACSECTLYNGANKVFGKYPTVRVFDRISKVIMHLCNQYVGCLWSMPERTSITQVVDHFLSDCKNGDEYTKPIIRCYNYANLSVNQDGMTKDLCVIVYIMPISLSKWFRLTVYGRRNGWGCDWEQSITETKDEWE